MMKLNKFQIYVLCVFEFVAILLIILCFKLAMKCSEYKKIVDECKLKYEINYRKGQ